AGGGVDIRASRHFEIRLLNVDYYRTSFGANTTQNYYTASAGIILRLFGSSSAE
ncbi:MAG: cell envelope biogenesis protein OmpA, partial [Acidobacteria bacterium]